MNKTESIAREIIRGMVDHYESFITSWAAWDEKFTEARKKGIIKSEWKDATVFRALKYAETKGWIKAEWGGFNGGITPYAGSARRQRNYIITLQGKKATLFGRCTGCCMISCESELKKLCNEIRQEEQINKSNNSIGGK